MGVFGIVDGANEVYGGIFHRNLTLFLLCPEIYDRAFPRMSESKYYVSVPGGEAKGPLSAESIREMRTCGTLSAQHVVWCEGMTESVYVDDFLASQLGGAGSWGLASALRSCLKRYAKFSGRASRSEYWYFQLALILIYMVVFALSYLLIPRLSDALVPVAMMLPLLVLLALFMPSLSVLVRRLHDADFSGWWVLLYIIPYIGGLVIFIFTLLPSVNQANKYGFGPAGPEA